MTHAFGYFELTDTKIGATGLTVTIDIDRTKLSTGATTIVATGAACTEIRKGRYGYAIPSYDPVTYDYTWTMITSSDDVIAKEIAGWRGNLAYGVTIAVSATQADEIVAGNYPIYKGYTFDQSLTSTITEDLSAADKIYATVKKNVDEDDDEAIIFWEEGAIGLTVLNREEYEGDPANGDIIVTGSSGAYSIELRIEAAATYLLDIFGNDFSIEVKAIFDGADPVYVTGGTAPISRRFINAID